MLDELKTIRGGETGFGILIESDAGYISPIEYGNDRTINKLSDGTESHAGVITGPLVVIVVLQKWGIKNRNGRIYPKNVLEREAQKYQQLIDEKRALGECVPGGTGIYTENGWKKIEDVLVGDNVFTLNTETNKLEVQPVLNTTAKHYNDDMIHIYGSNIDMMITKKHKVVLWDRNDNPYILTGEELYSKLNSNDSKVNHSYIKHSGDWIGESPEFFTIPNSDIKIPIDDWAAFLGIYIAEGHCAGTKGGETNNMVCITQVKPHTKQILENLLDSLPFEYYLHDDRQYKIYNKELRDHLFELGNSYEKHIPKYAKNWSPELLSILLKWLLIGDGKNRKNGNGQLLKEYFTTSNKLSEDVFEIMMKTGNGATITEQIQKDRYITDVKEVEVDGLLELVKTKRLIKANNSKPLKLIHERTSKGVYLDSRFIKAEKIAHNDMVYCVTVANGTWLMNYNNKISWTHNSDHPETSIISIDRVAHNIKRIWWEGKTLLGEMEIIMTRGFKNLGICSTEGDKIANLLLQGYKIGVSSRGVGSLKEIGGDQIVQDDFEIICWDAVTAPSTPGSWISKDIETAKQFVESENKSDKTLLTGLNNFLLG